MHPPTITALYSGLLAFVFAALSFNVVRLRRTYKLGFGDGDHPSLRSAIRAHANFAEYMPIIILLAASLEILGEKPAIVHAILVALIVARVLHPFGMFAKVGTAQFTLGRVFGTILTNSILVVAAALTLARALA